MVRACVLHSNSSGWSSVSCCCEHCYEPLGSIKGGSFPDQLNYHQLLSNYPATTWQRKPRGFAECSCYGETGYLHVNMWAGQRCAFTGSEMASYYGHCLEVGVCSCSRVEWTQDTKQNTVDARFEARNACELYSNIQFLPSQIHHVSCT